MTKLWWYSNHTPVKSAKVTSACQAAHVKSACSGILLYTTDKPHVLIWNLYAIYLLKNELGIAVRTANGNPKPMKYGQLLSMNVSRLCSSHPMLNHLYSKEYREYSKHMCTRHSTSPRNAIGSILTSVLWKQSAPSAVSMLLCISVGSILH
jgi:hypothetical protein